MITGSGTTSLRKRDLENQKIPAVGFVKQFFAHKSASGDTGINLTSLTTPPEMSTNGFINPTTAQLSSANLLFFKNNLTLLSSARGPLQQALSYRITSSTQITFLGFTALEGEIFTGIIDYSVISGIKVVDATAQPATGTLAAGTTDFNIGQFFLTNKYSTTQLGACSIYMDGDLQLRNTANSSTNLDGNYYEVDNGSGSFSVVRFNLADPDKPRNIVAIPTGLLSERPDGSMMTVIENLQGQVNNLAPYVATLAGVTQTTLLGSSPTNVDLKSFGDRVVAVEGNRARIDLSNTWTAAQPLIGVTDGSAAASTVVGEAPRSFVPYGSGVTAAATATFGNVTSISLLAGDWDVSGVVVSNNNGSTQASNWAAAISVNSGNSTTDHQEGDNLVYAVPSTSTADSTLVIPSYRISVSALTIVYLKSFFNYSAGSPKASGRISARRAR